MPLARQRGGAKSSPRPRHFLAVSVAVALLALCGCSSAAPAQALPPAKPGTVTVLATNVPGVGTVLVNAKGYTLYMFVPDGRRRVTCISVCAAQWPPLWLRPGLKLVAGHGVSGSLLSSDPDPAGGRVVTYGGWPLYTYVGDTKPGQSNGQALNLSGGLWYVMRPSGKPLESGQQT